MPSPDELYPEPKNLLDGAEIKQAPETPPHKDALHEMIGNLLMLYRDTLAPQDIVDVLEAHQRCIIDDEADRQAREQG